VHRRLHVVPALFVAMALVAGACGGGDDDDDDAASVDSAVDTSTSSVAPTTESTEPPTTTTAEAGPVAPLTGVTITEDEAEELATRPALAVKTDNHPNARPQYGLDVADVVYEEPVEGITRYIAVYHSQDPGIVGPIRSVRGIDAKTLQPLNALFAISGGVAGFVQAAQQTTQLFQEGTEGYYRDPDRARPYNLLSTTAELWAAADEGHRTQPQSIFSYLDDDETFVGDPADSIRFGFQATSIVFDWDDASGTWLRTLDGTPHLTAPNDVQVAPTNVIIQYLNPQFVEMGEGRALFFVDGQVIEGLWSKPEPGAVTRFTNVFGADMELEPGQTWVNMVRSGTEIEVVADGASTIREL
jgi:hypothetical protein